MIVYTPEKTRHGRLLKARQGQMRKGWVRMDAVEEVCMQAVGYELCLGIWGRGTR